MNRLKSFFLNLPEILFFFSIFISSIGVIWTVIEILDRFKVDLTFFDNLGPFNIYLILLHSTLFSFISLYFKNIIGTKNHNIDQESTNESLPSDTLFIRGLVVSLEDALKAKNYLEVIKIGTSLSRPFFESGNYKVRLQIGLLVEEAAALIKNISVQMKELIDTIGWSYVELGELEKGERYIKHGKEIAKKIEDFYYISKAQRHLGAIARRRGDFLTAENNYKESIEYADKVLEDTPRTELLAGINYALSSLFLHKNEHEKSLSHIDISIEGFTQLGDEYKLTMAQVLKGNILFLLKRREEAKDIFRIAIHSSEQRTERLQIVRCYIGLTKIYLQESDWKRAKENLAKADELKANINSASEVSEIESLRNKIPNN